MINIADIGYDVELLTENGSWVVLNDAIQTLQWEEQEGQLAQSATVNIVNVEMDDGWLIEKAKLNCIIRIWGRITTEKKLVFQGPIWEWDYSSNAKNEMSIVAYDPLIRLQQSKDFRYYSAGKNTQTIISDICRAWEIPLSYKWGRSISHEKKKFSSQTISEMIKNLLDEVRARTGEKYTIRFCDEQLQILGYGTNSMVYNFNMENTLSTADRLSLRNLVTRVKIVGPENKNGDARVESLVDGDLRYGVLQEIIQRDSNKKLTAAREEANVVLKERGKPDEMIQAVVPDIPFMRKGDAVEVTAGNLTGIFYIEGVTHNTTAGQMTMTLTRLAQESVLKKSRPTLRKGSRGQDVTDMQTLLVGYGHTLPIYGIDGYFYNETDRAVKGFQRARGLAVDGICGPKTWAKLEG